MTTLEAVFLGAVQGIAEFLPVSSSAHLSILSQVFGIPNQDFAFYIFLNIGSLLALIVFYWNDVWKLILGALGFIFNKKTETREFFLTIFLSSLPVIVVFGVAEVIFDIDVHSPVILASSMIVFAGVLYFCDGKAEGKASVSRRDSLIAGMVQVVSIIPGVSRLGSCLSALRYMECTRIEAFRHSMILSMPPVAGACFLKSIKILTGKIVVESWEMVSVGVFSAFVFGIISLSAINVFLRKNSFLLFVIYRIFFGIFIIFKFCSIY